MYGFALLVDRGARGSVAALGLPMPALALAATIALQIGAGTALVIGWHSKEAVVRDRYTRGHTDMNRLDSEHTFSFGNYRDREHMGFGTAKSEERIRG